MSRVAGKSFFNSMSGAGSGGGRVSGTVYGAAVPPLGEYEAWWNGRPDRAKTRDAFTPARYRRMAVMLANGDGIGEIVRAQGLSKSTVKSALERLPRSLGGLSDDK